MVFIFFEESFVGALRATRICKRNPRCMLRAYVNVGTLHATCPFGHVHVACNVPTYEFP